jgi:hypothetical protein
MVETNFSAIRAVSIFSVDFYVNLHYTAIFTKPSATFSGELISIPNFPLPWKQLSRSQLSSFS